jgi:3-hydroxybutyryl-CoA dehydratase
MEMKSVGQQYREEFSISVDQVRKFAEASGDWNPLHFDHEFTKNTIFLKPIAHGLLSSSVFSKILGTNFPGEGTIYLEQNLKFLKPVYPNEKYLAELTVVEIMKKNQAILSTKVYDNAGGLVIDGTAKIKNPRIIALSEIC